MIELTILATRESLQLYSKCCVCVCVLRRQLHCRHWRAGRTRMAGHSTVGFVWTQSAASALNERSHTCSGRSHCVQRHSYSHFPGNLPIATHGILNTTDQK